MLVEVKPLPLKKWHGKQGRESFGQPKIVEVLINTETGRYQTGLTEEEAAHYGKLLGVDLSDTVEFEKPHPYWSTKPSWISLPNSTAIFNTDKPSDYVKVKNLKASHKVANSMEAWENGEFPNATHVIFDETEEVENKATKIALQQNAIALLPKMTQEDKIAMVTILSDKHKSVRNQSESFITVELDELIKNKATEFIRVAKMGREEVSLRAKILDLVNVNVLTKEAGSYYYMGELIGMDYEDTVDWFKNPQNAKMRVMMLEKLEKKV
jgi:hypothetical protein